MTAPVAAAPQQAQPPQPPWHPFQPRPNDSEPPIAMKWIEKLSALMSTVKYDAMKQKFPAWAQPFDQQYQRMVQIVQAAQPQPPLPKGVTVQARPTDAAGVAQAEQAADHPQQTGGTQPQPPTRPTRPTLPQGGKPLGGRSL